MEVFLIDHMGTQRYKTPIMVLIKCGANLVPNVGQMNKAEKLMLAYRSNEIIFRSEFHYPGATEI